MSEVNGNEVKQPEKAVNKKDELVFVLRKPIKFEGETIESFNYERMNDATTNDLVLARRMMNSHGSSLEIYPERSMEFACYFAAVTLKKPAELFLNLKPVDGMRLKNLVADFLY